MTRDAGPKPGVKYVFYDVYDKDENRIKAKNDDQFGPDGPFGPSDPYSEHIGIVEMAKVPHPHTAYNIKQYLCTLEHIGHYNHTELYGRMSDNEPYNDNDHVDLHHVGTTKRHPIALVKSSDKHVDIPRGSNNVSNNVNVQPAFTRKLVAKYTCDWRQWPEAIQHLNAGEELWTDGLMTHGLANEPAWMAINSQGQQGLVSSMYAYLQ